MCIKDSDVLREQTHGMGLRGIVETVLAHSGLIEHYQDCLLYKPDAVADPHRLDDSCKHIAKHTESRLKGREQSHAEKDQKISHDACKCDQFLDHPGLANVQ